MATATAKTSRLDMRLTPVQKSEIELAASIKGMKLTEWATDCLMKAAKKAIDEETTTRLTKADFEAFTQALDEGIPLETQRLLAEKPVWDE